MVPRDTFLLRCTCAGKRGSASSPAKRERRLTRGIFIHHPPRKPFRRAAGVLAVLGCFDHALLGSVLRSSDLMVRWRRPDSGLERWELTILVNAGVEFKLGINGTELLVC